MGYLYITYHNGQTCEYDFIVTSIEAYNEFLSVTFINGYATFSDVASWAIRNA